MHSFRDIFRLIARLKMPKTKELIVNLKLVLNQESNVKSLNKEHQSSAVKVITKLALYRVI